MKQKHTQQRIFLMLAIGILISCNNTSEKSTDNTVQTDSNATGTNATENTNVSETPECYINTKSKDSMLLHLTVKNNIVTGNMNYQIAGKDKNQGTLQGEMRGDTLFADYTFSSEGTQSVRQVAYLKKDNSLLEGYGDVEERGNKMVFKNTGKLTFGKGVILQKTDCSK